MSELSPMRERCGAAIRKLGWAYVLLHLDINLGTLNLLPNWAGYLMILSVLPVLAEWSPSATLLKPLGTFLAANDLLQWLVKLIDFSMETTAFTSGLYALYTLLCAIVSLYFHFQLLTDVAGMAHFFAYEDEASFLKMRTLYTMLMTVIPLLLYLPEPPQMITVSLLVVNLVIALILCRMLLVFGKWLQQGLQENDSE